MTSYRVRMMFEDMSPLQLCPLHCSTEGGSLQRMNTPRNRRPLLQCCSAATLHMSPSSAAVQCCAEAEARLQARRLVLRNIAIPASFYTATDPRHADTRAALRSLGTRQAPGPGSRLVSRSAPRPLSLSSSLLMITLAAAAVLVVVLVRVCLHMMTSSSGSDTKCKNEVRSEGQGVGLFVSESESEMLDGRVDSPGLELEEDVSRVRFCT